MKGQSQLGAGTLLFGVQDSGVVSARAMLSPSFCRVTVTSDKILVFTIFLPQVGLKGMKADPAIAQCITSQLK